MTEDEHFDDVEGEAGAIGVGMGGSCPVCRAPVDLGQEFCLECGSPIRFTPRQRRQQRGRPANAGAAGRAAPPAKTGFPWAPFLVVLALLGGGGVFALVDTGDDSDRTSQRESTEDALPTITNSAPTETESETSTTTVEDCASASPIEDTVPAIGDAGTGIPPTSDPNAGASPGEQIPELGSDGASGLDGAGVPSTEPEDGGGETVTVDANGFLCDDTGSGSDTDVTDTTSTTNDITPTETTPTNSASGDWPAGEEGWTVIVAGYPNDEARARDVAADLQQKGFTDGGVLLSTDFSSLCPGFHVVFSGTFKSRSQAESRLGELSDQDYAGMYVREIKRSGSPPSNCTQARPQT